MYAKVQILWENDYTDTTKFATISFGRGLCRGKDNGGAWQGKRWYWIWFCCFISNSK